MSLYQAMGNALTTLIEWIAIIYSAFCEWLGISEWMILNIVIVIIFALIGISRKRKSRP